MIGLISISDLTPENIAGKVLYAETDFESLYKVEGIRWEPEMWLITSYKVPGLMPVQRSFMVHSRSNVIIADQSESEAAIMAYQLKIQADRKARMMSIFSHNHIDQKV